MRGLHRLLVTGAFGGLAAATIAASGAFACTELASVKVTQPGDPQAEVTKAKPEEEVDITVDDFNPYTEPGQDFEAKDVVVVLQALEKEGFKTPADILLAVLHPLGATTRVTLPAAARVESGEYIVVARQFDVAGVQRGEDWVPLHVVGGELTRAAEVKSPTAIDPGLTETSPASVTAPTPEPTDGSKTLVTQPSATGSPSDAAGAGNGNSDGNSSVSRGSSSGSGGAPGSRQPSSSSSGPGSSSSTGGAASPLPSDVLANIPAIPGSDAATMLARLNGQAEPVSADLWSGIDPNRGRALLDTESPSEEWSGSPAGGLLLGGGALALALVALVEGRRRLAVSRVTLR